MKTGTISTAHRFVSLLFAAGLALATPALATDYYVRIDGNDANAGTGNSSSAAWGTLKKCLSVAKSGDRCLIQPGTYLGQRGAVFTNAGALESNNLLSNCTCTKGTTSIGCGSAIPTTVNPGDYVQCDSGYGFSWSRVASVSGSTITLAEPYRGATSTSGGSDTLDVANFVVVSGQGAAPSDVVFSDWVDAPTSVTWTQDSTYADVWSYDPSTITGTDNAAKAWRAKWCSNDNNKSCTADGDCGSGNTCRVMLKGIRDWNFAAWDRDRLPTNNGIEGYDRLGSSSVDPSYGTEQAQRHVCPSGDNMTHVFNVSSVPGSYSYDTSGAAKVYVHTRRFCSGGSSAGRHCLADSDCFGGGVCAAAKSPANYRMQAALAAPLGDQGQLSASIMLDARKNFVIVENLTIDGGFHGTGGSGAVPSEALLLGGSNARYSNLQVWSGQVRWYFSTAGGSAGSTDTQFEHIDAWGGNYCSPEANDSPVSGMKFYDVEMRGTGNQVFNCDSMRGAANDDRIVFDRAYFHRNYPNKTGDGNNDGSTCNGNVDLWDETNDRFKDGTALYDPGHGPYWGHPEGGSYVTCNILVQNSIAELTSDGVAAFTRASSTDPSCKDVIFANNTFALEGVANEALHARFGVDASGSGSGKLYNNVFLSEWTSTSMAVVWRGATTDPATIQSDYNMFVYYADDANGAGAAPTSPRIWGRPNVYESLSQVISSYSQERNSIVVCKDGCAGATPGTHFNSADARFVDYTVDDGDRTDYTPLATNWGVNAGAPNATYPCPKEDFYGNPRSDGSCDIGAVEYQGGADTTPPAAVTNFTTTAGDTQLTLKWTHSVSSDSRGTMIRYKTSGTPTSASDGALACDKQGPAGSADQCVHAGLTNGTTYFYAAFSYDAVPNYGSGVSAQGTPNATPNTPPSDVGGLVRTDTK